MILLRHGQSEFNLHYTVTRVDPGIEDPRLTPLGHQQAEQAATALAGDPIERIIASPYTRALQTAAPLAKRLGLPVLVTTAVRERYAFVCDVGSPVADLAAAWPGHDFTALDDIWWQRTVVVSHWGFIMALTGLSVQNGQWLRVDPTAPGPAEIVWRV
jgi:broad specificity phosphatase PhoE